jgi:hypothetical protein
MPTYTDSTTGKSVFLYLFNKNNPLKILNDGDNYNFQLVDETGKFKLTVSDSSIVTSGVYELQLLDSDLNIIGRKEITISPIQSYTMSMGGANEDGSSLPIDSDGKTYVYDPSADTYTDPSISFNFYQDDGTGAKKPIDSNKFQIQYVVVDGQGSSDNNSLLNQSPTGVNATFIDFPSTSTSPDSCKININKDSIPKKGSLNINPNLYSNS